MRVIVCDAGPIIHLSEPHCLKKALQSMTIESQNIPNDLDWLGKKDRGGEDCFDLSDL
jgi:hypothetical protein